MFDCTCKRKQFRLPCLNLIAEHDPGLVRSRDINAIVASLNYSGVPNVNLPTSE